MRKFGLKYLVPAGALLVLAACGQNDSASEATDGTESAGSGNPEAQAIIEARQAQLKKVGSAFKTINDQLKSGNPDLAAIQAAAASVPVETATMADWFPEGTGPEAGVETEALPVIWETRADFEQKIADFQAAAAQLASVAEGGDVAAIGAAFGATGGTCKACHDNYRLDD